MKSDVRTNQVVLELLVLSALSLFVELLVIRWLSSDIRMFSIFRTFPLVTCFVGLGVGFSSSGKTRLFNLTLPALLQFVASIKVAEFFGVSNWRFPSTSTYYFQNLSLESLAYVAVCLLSIILILAGPFAICVCIGNRLGALFNELEPLVAYSINLGGAILGSIVFAGACFLGVSPETLSIISGLAVLACLLFEKNSLIKPALLFVIFAAITFIPASQSEFGMDKSYKTDAKTFWSPYQRLDLSVFHTNKDNEFVGLNIATNRSFYQYYFNDLIPLDRTPASFTELIKERRAQYLLPYRLASDVEDVLILGAGTGQNILPALDHHAQNVDAVDIDQVILNIGKEFNPSYGNTKVHAICDDARHYLKGCKKKYDRIIFTLLDSQAVVGQGSSVRLDTYVYTEQSVKQALTLLKPSGLIVMSFACRPWIEGRLYKTLKAAAGYPPLIASDTSARKWGADVVIFLLGGPVERKEIVLPAEWLVHTKDDSEAAPILTDDWPYLYVRPEVLDLPYLSVIVLTLMVSILAGRKLLFGASDKNCWQLFMLGAAFTLLELHAISLISLIYGSTWLTSAIVINGILILLWVANFLVLRFHERLRSSQTFIYFALFASIIFSYLTPPQSVLQLLPGSVGEIALTLLTILPLGMAGLLFPVAFAENRDSAKAIAFNLLGSVVGGLLEYLSNFTGIKNLEIIGLVLYLISMLIRQPWRIAPSDNGGKAPDQAFGHTTSD